MFHGTDLLPVWVVWTVGPLCWYLGCAVALVGGVVTLGHFLKSVKERAVERAQGSGHTPVQVDEPVCPCECDP